MNDPSLSIAPGMAGRLIVLAGYNGFPAAQSWVRHRRREDAQIFAWRQADQAAEAIAAGGAPVTLIGHSMGGGQAQSIARRLPAGAIHTLITVAPFAPRDLDTAAVRRDVGVWLNIVSARRWHDPLLAVAARLVFGWREQGVIADASENYTSRHPHQDFYRMMAERCGAVVASV